MRCSSADGKMASVERVESSSNESQFNRQIQAYLEFAKYLFVTGKGFGTSTEYPGSKSGHVDSLQAYSEIYL